MSEHGKGVKGETDDGNECPGAKAICMAKKRRHGVVEADKEKKKKRAMRYGEI